MRKSESSTSRKGIPSCTPIRITIRWEKQREIRNAYTTSTILKTAFLSACGTPVVMEARDFYDFKSNISTAKDTSYLIGGKKSGFNLVGEKY